MKNISKIYKTFLIHLETWQNTEIFLVVKACSLQLFHSSLLSRKIWHFFMKVFESHLKISMFHFDCSIIVYYPFHCNDSMLLNLHTVKCSKLMTSKAILLTGTNWSDHSKSSSINLTLRLNHLLTLSILWCVYLAQVLDLPFSTPWALVFQACTPSIVFV